MAVYSVCGADPLWQAKTKDDSAPLAGTESGEGRSIVYLWLRMLTWLITVRPEFTTAGWPVNSVEARAARDAIADTHIARPLPAYDLRGNLIHPSLYTDELRRATVLVGFTMTHYDIAQRRGNSSFQTKCQLCLDVQYMRVLIPPPQHSTHKRTSVQLNDPMSNAAKKLRV